MAHVDSDFEARFKRVRARTEQGASMPRQQSVRDDDRGASAFVGALLRSQLALILGVVALILGRAVAMNQLGVEASPDLLGPAEAAVILPLLLVFGFLLGRSQVISHVVMVTGAVLAFLCEGYYLPLAPDLMAFIYTTDYVEAVRLSML